MYSEDAERWFRSLGILSNESHVQKLYGKISENDLFLLVSELTAHFFREDKQQVVLQKVMERYVE